MSINNQVQAEEEETKPKAKSKKSLIQWRRDLVFEYITKGMSQVEIAKKLQLDESTISKDMRYIREKCRVGVKKYFEETLPFEINTTWYGLFLILRDMWKAADNTNDIGEKIQCYKLIMDAYETRLKYMCNFEMEYEGMKYVEEFKKKHKEGIMKALETEQKQQRH